MAKAVLANLGQAGWIDNPLLMGTTMMKYYMLTSSDFDLHHNGNIDSIGRDMAESGNDQSAIMDAIEGSLRFKFGEVFDEVDVTLESVDNNTISLRLSYSQRETGVRCDLSYGLIVSDGGFMELARYNRTGGVIELDKVQL